MINNWDHKDLKMDYSNLPVRCSDIDLMHICDDGFLILGEIKTGKGSLSYGQRHMLEKIIDGHKAGGCLLWIKHGKETAYGDTLVDVNRDCYVVAMYQDGQWLMPKKTIKAGDAIQMIAEKRGSGSHSLQNQD